MSRCLDRRHSLPTTRPTEAKVRLGEELFFDSILSGGQRRSCGTCHKRELHFMDGLSRGWGPLDESELSRKTPGLLNVGWQRTMFFDGRVKTLEEQVSKPLENHREMSLDPAEAVERIRRDPFYVRSFGQAFPGEEITFDLVAKAIASFERTLVSYDSDLDRYLLGDEAALSASAKRGMALFTGKAECIRCHNGPMLTDHDFHYTGVAERDGHGDDGTKYKTQSLRDALRRYSYMHNGRMMNIRQVIEHYDRGGSAPESMQPEIRPLGLSEAEKDDLVAFLSAFNGRVHRLTEGFPAGAGSRYGRGARRCRHRQRRLGRIWGRGRRSQLPESIAQPSVLRFMAENLLRCQPPLILASASPRRADLLARAGVEFEQRPVGVDESWRGNERVECYVQRLAAAKAEAAWEPGRRSLGADTAVTVRGEVLGKPRDSADAKRMLRKLSDRPHRVLTGVAVFDGELRLAHLSETWVVFRALTEQEIDEYVASGEPLDKAGAYGIQGGAGRFAEAVIGSYDNVVGLPVDDLDCPRE